MSTTVSSDLLYNVHYHTDTDRLNIVNEVICATDFDSLSTKAKAHALSLGLDNENFVDQYSIDNFFKDLVSGYRLTYSSARQLVEVQLQVAIGGPSIWLHVDEFGNCEVIGSWAGEKYTAFTRHELYAAIFYLLNEIDL